MFDRPPLTLHAGALSLLFAGVDARYLRVGPVEVLRRIHTTVRDEHWGTVPAQVSSPLVHVSGRGFRVEYEAEHRSADIDFVWRTTIEAQAVEGTETNVELSFTAAGEARSTFRTNRTGLCVLHPIDRCAGHACVIEHSDGTIERGRFPRLIAPHQPFRDICAITHEPQPGLEVRVRLEGDIFEMEDHRNWTDGSFKTYCRPLSRPFPYVLERGDRVVQKVTVCVRGSAQVADMTFEASTRELRVGAVVGPLPRLGLQANTHEIDVQRLRPLNLSHLRFDVNLPQDHRARLDRVAEACRSLSVPLEIALHMPVDGNGPLGELVDHVVGLRVPIARWVVYENGRPMASAAAVHRVRQLVRKHSPAAPVGGGTIGNFTELNRNRPAAGSVDLLAYPVNPQMHAADSLTLIENLEGQGDTVRTARDFAPGVPLAVGPVSFHRRPDPFAAGRAGAKAETGVGDHRQSTQLGALWTLGCVKQLAEAGADSVTLYETSGPMGVMDEHRVFPLYDVLAGIGQLAGGTVVACRSSAPLAFDGLILTSSGRARLMLANYSDRPEHVIVNGLPAVLHVDLAPSEIRRIDVPSSPGEP